ncbi:Protein kinase rad3-like protein, partial [Cladobotryum mycophilum]
MSQRRIVVSIDFGTTFSGIAWADTARPEVKHILSDWPSANGVKSSPKVPTELRKVAKGWQWGYQIPESAKRSRFFKLWVLTESMQCTELTFILSKLDEPVKVKKDGESAQELTKIYLSCLHDHFISVLEKRLSPDVVQSTPMDFIVTVPAIWSNTAKQETKNAASMAGFCGNQRITLISEPEAAALYTVKNLSPSVLQIRRRFVVCDAGGGTVDLITYEVTRVDGLEVKEVTEGTGGKCGSSMLNMRFRRYLKQTHGEKYWTNDRLVIAVNEFEAFKRDFSPKGEPLTLRVDPSLGVKRNRFTIPQDDMTNRIIEPIMKDVICLIKEQITMARLPISAIVLVGGFGQSRYLRSRVRDSISSSIHVLQPENGVTAVVKGAIIHGLSQYQPRVANMGIASRVARRSYGTCLMAKYDMLKHDHREVYWSEKEQERVVIEMCWFIRKGESYPEGRPCTIQYQCDVPVLLGHSPQTEINIFSHDGDGPVPMHVDSNTRLVATLYLDLHKIPKSVKAAAGKTKMGWHRYYCLSGVIEAHYGSAMVTYALELGARECSRDYVFAPLSSRRVQLIASNLVQGCQFDSTHPTCDARHAMNDGLNSNRVFLGAAGMAANAVESGPPPSTLAAQLVENISTSSKVSRSDENSELKGLFAVIQRVKDNPDLLKTHSDRIEHNHMLIYVYCRVVLEGIKLDDPFLDRVYVRTESLKAINFLRFTIKETPSVLNSRNNGRGLLFRGLEPLWIWLLPQLLRLLGHSHCIDLEGSIEGFLQYVLLIVARTGTLWKIAPLLGLYLRASLTSLLDHLQDPSLIPSHKDVRMKLELPPSYSLDQVLEQGGQYVPKRLSYSIFSATQALRQCASLARVLAYPLTSQDSAFSSSVSLSENGPWLMDVCLDLRHVQKRWEVSSPSSPIPLIETTLEVIKASALDSDMVSSLRDKACALLVLLCGEMVSAPDELIQTDETGERARSCCCMALIILAQASLKSYSVGRLAASKIVQELNFLSSQYSAVGEDTDVWRCMMLLGQVIRSNLQEVFSESLHPSKFHDEELRECVQELGLKHEQPSEVSNGAKKRKICQEDAGFLPRITQAIYDVLQVPQPSDDDVVMLEQVFLDGFDKSEQASQCLAIELLSRICCFADNSDKTDSSQAISPASVECALCEGGAGSARAIVSPNAKGEVRLIFSKLVRLTSFLESRRPRVAAMIALRRLILHCEDTAFLNLETSGPGQWCLQSLNSSIRELRIAAGRTLAAFMPQKPSRFLDEELLCRNRKNSIALLRSISETDQPLLVETRILAWGQLGRVVTEDELNLILIKLLEYLGSSNNIESAFAFNELLNLAEARRISPRRLFEPFWKSLAYLATKDMVQRPQRSRAIAELLQISVNELLLLIQTHALPWLVLDRRKDVIQKISEARQENETWISLLDNANLAAILSLLMVQETEDIEGFAKSRLDEISPHFHALRLLDILQTEPVLIAIELLKAAGEADSSRKRQIHKALTTMATMMLSPNRETKNKKGNVIGRFLQSHILGLMARLTDVINDSISNYPPVMEQRSCIRALEEMIKLCQAYARLARPQISACLLSAASQDSLREVAISCWASMLKYFDEEDVEALIETTFFIVSRYWSVLNASTIAIAKGMLDYVLQKYEAVIRKYITHLPSLSHIAQLSEIEEKLNTFRPALIPEEALEIFAQRIGHDYSGVVHQALSELVPYLRSNQSALYMSAVSQRPDSVITTLLRALLDCSCKYNGIQVDITRLCVECIGLIGCLDSNQIEAVREQRSIVVLDNFETMDEATDFSIFLLEEVLVPSFLSTTDTKHQGFLSFVIQELLDRCEIKDACTMHNSGMLSGTEIYKKWMGLPESIRDVVTPFLNSRYMVAPMNPPPVDYPIFYPGRSYGNWLRAFVVDLLRKGQHPVADIIFEPLTRVIRVKDLSTAEFLLPYLVLHVLLGPRSSEEEKDRVLGEMKNILQHRPAQDSLYQEKEDMGRFCHIVFRFLDYAMRWIHAKRSSGRLSGTGKETVSRIQGILDGISAEVIAERAIDCNDYARALFHLEQHAQKMEQGKRNPGDRTRLLQRLQDIYANIDEPDGLEGISAHLHVLDINQQILSHKKAGRWTAAQTWYEMQLAAEPDNLDVQLDLLNCLKQAGQHDVLLNHIEGMRTDSISENKIMPFAVEAAWVTGRWENLANFTGRFQGSVIQDFNMSLAGLFYSLHKKCSDTSFRESAAHEMMLKCHVLTDLEIIVGAKMANEDDRSKTMALLNGRLEVIGAYVNDKQYILGIQRAAMELIRPAFADLDISGLWLTSARLARKTNSLHQSFNAVLHASQLGDDAATIENAKLLWRDSHHRKAIQMLQG